MSETKGLQELTVTVENRFGALFRIVGAFSARGYNIETLHVTPDPMQGVSFVKLAFICDRRQHEQVAKQLRKLAEVVEVVEVFETPVEPINAFISGDQSNGKSVLRAGR